MSDQLPTGMVTVVFTDIEGSTRLIEQLGELAYIAALAEHRRRLRAAFAAHGGVEIGTEGDSFFYVFPDPVEALSAAAAGQVALAGVPVKVRMGLHTGALHLTGEGYAGRELHLAARVAASGHGGQVVVSAATRALVDEGLVDLGEHRLKDFDEPISLFQLGSERFPPLKTISNTNLPRPASSLIGRSHEREELLQLVRSGARLVTLSGPGGSGKTRLAIEVAAELVEAFNAGVFWVGLSALRDPRLVIETIAQTLGARGELIDHIGDRELLLLLDNFEQVVEAAPDLSRLLESCPRLALMVTSRELLRIRGELEYPVAQLAERDAVELFCDRAHIAPDEDVNRLCRRLDDLPLAVELAAARVSVLTPSQLLDRLGQRLDLLKGGRDADPRQQTLRATIEWSHDLLTATEPTLFADVAVFVGGCDLEAAECVCGADLDVLQSLVEKSLIRRTGDRFWMLETIREYAAERLEASGRGDQLRRRHSTYFAEMVEAAEPHKRGGPAQQFWIDRIAAEHDNLRAATAWALDRDIETAARIAANLDWYFFIRGHVSEATAWTERALSARALLDPALRARLLIAGSLIAHLRGDMERTARWADEAFVLYTDLGDDVGTAAALRQQAFAAVFRDDHEVARARYEQCLAIAQRVGDVQDEAIARNNLGDIALRQGRYLDTIQLCSHSRALRLEIGDRWGAALALLNVGHAEMLLGRNGEAESDLRQALRESAKLRSVGTIQACLECLALLRSRRGDAAAAAHLLGAATTLREDNGIADSGVSSETHDELIASLIAALGSEPLAGELDIGQNLPLEDAVRMALGDSATSAASDAPAV